MIKVVTLMEDSAGSPNVRAEHGLCFYIETPGHRLLMDTGASDLTWENAQTLGADIRQVDTVAISHGHYDHAGGLLGFARRNQNATIYMQDSAGGDFFHGGRYIGIDKQILQLPNLRLLRSGAIHRIDNELLLFSGITGRRLWPGSNQALSEQVGEKRMQDHFVHEQCLVICSEGKQALISGCAHNGILNIIDRFREIYHIYPDVVISGFHMMKKTDYTEEEKESIEKTARELSEMPTVFYTGHCTGKPAFDIMKSIMRDQLRLFHSGDTFFAW